MNHHLLINSKHVNTDNGEQTLSVVYYSEMSLNLIQMNQN